jgi:uncharacterized protein YkwD
MVALVATMLMSGPAAALELTGDPAAARLLAVEQTLLDLTNADRVSNGLPALEFDAETLAIARARAAAQLGSDNLSHYNERGLLAFVQLLDDAGLPYGVAGENLARSEVSNAPDTLQKIEAALMNSPIHRKNILEARFARAAIGSASDANGRIAFAEIFRGD